MKEKILAIVNPISSNGRTGKEWPKYEKTIRDSGIEIHVEYTKQPLHATKISRNALENGYEI